MCAHVQCVGMCDITLPAGAVMQQVFRGHQHKRLGEGPVDLPSEHVEVLQADVCIIYLCVHVCMYRCMTRKYVHAFLSYEQTEDGGGLRIATSRHCNARYASYIYM